MYEFITFKVIKLDNLINLSSSDW